MTRVPDVFQPQPLLPQFAVLQSELALANVFASLIIMVLREILKLFLGCSHKKGERVQLIFALTIPYSLCHSSPSPPPSSSASFLIFLLFVMYSNPFGAWGSGSQQTKSTPTPSVFGALPYTGIAVSDLVTFYFSSFRPDVLNCVVTGRQNQVYYRIDTDIDAAGYSVITNSEGAKIALVEWRNSPAVEVRGVVHKQPINHWLRLSPNRSSRDMEVRGMRYVWTPVDKSINLYTSGISGVTFLARITRGSAHISLEITPDALQLGLLDSVIVATLLLQCGRNID
ncbi:hypothetical protein D9615_008553 [Tricholomella constricta]|uniref:DUF6593 domain-containing protein n=1 Tax=Tricholomella constricta TaxID=117010 RepID=A0A8H5M0F5_9AGAR|nr:hypothetical protein D9615_008553 [Tricholomella constricta]